MEGHVQVEAHGFGICLRTAVMPGESPQAAADRLVLSEDRRRRALHNAWLRGQDMAQPAGGYTHQGIVTSLEFAGGGWPGPSPTGGLIF